MFSIFSPNAGKYQAGKLQIRILFTQYIWRRQTENSWELWYIFCRRWLRPLILQSILLDPIQLKCCLSLKNVLLVMLQDIYMPTKFAFTFHEFSLINSVNSRSIKGIKKVFDASSVKYLESNRKIRQLCTPYLHIFF